jgi:hypothetical protein
LREGSDFRLRAITAMAAISDHPISRPPDHPIPLGPGNSLHNRNVARTTLNVRHYRLTLFWRGNSTSMLGIERRQVSKWQRKLRSARMKKL